MFQELVSTAKKLAKDRTVRAVILTGSGKSFCSGLDVLGIAKTPSNGIKLLEKPAGTIHSNLAQDVGYLWRLCPFPVIAVTHGKCWGGGMQIALGADLRFSSVDCTFSIMEAKWGLIPDMSGSVTLRELVRLDVIKELAMTGRIISSAEAEKHGLITRVVEDPMDEAFKVASEIATKSPDAVAATKRLFQETYNSSEDVALNLETDLQKTLLPSWNQMAASARNFGVKVPYVKRKED